MVVANKIKKYEYVQWFEMCLNFLDDFHEFIKIYKDLRLKKKAILEIIINIKNTEWFGSWIGGYKKGLRLNEHVLINLS